MPDERIDFTTERQRYANFCGREDVLAEIEEKVADAIADGGFVLVSGGPGTGKSALLAFYLNLRVTELTPHHFFRRANATWAQPLSAVRSLSAQIEALYPQQRDPAEEKSPQRLRNLLARLSQNGLVGREHPLLLIIDALNEAQETGGDDDVQRVLPMQPLPGVVVLYSSRPQDPIPVPRARIVDLDKRQRSNDEACRQLLQQHAQELNLSASFIQEAVTRGGGNLLYTVSLLDWIKGPPRREPAIELLPHGLDEYLQQLWQQLAELPPDEEERTRRAVAFLCAARESLPSSILRSLVKWRRAGSDEQRFRKATRAFITEESQSGLRVYRPFHESFREFVLRALEVEQPGAVAQLHQALADHFAKWPAADVQNARFLRRYGLHHRLRHLIEAGKWSTARRLLTDLRYLVRRCHKEGPRGLLEDLRLGLSRRVFTAKDRLWPDLQWAFQDQLQPLLYDPGALPSVIYSALRSTGWPAKAITQTFHPAELLPPLRLVMASAQRVTGWAATLCGHRRSVIACTLTPDGRQIVSASRDGTIKIWDVESGELQASIPGPRDGSGCIILSSDGAYALLAAEYEFTQKFIKFPEGLEVASRDGVEQDLGWVALANGHQVMTASYGYLLGNALAPDGSVITYDPPLGNDVYLRMFDLRTGREESVVRIEAAELESCAICRDYVVTTSRDGKVRVWASSTGKEVVALQTEGAYCVDSYVMTNKQVLLICHPFGGLKAFDLQSGAEQLRVPVKDPRSFRIAADCARVAVLDGNNDLIVYDLARYEHVATIRCPDIIQSYCITADGRFVIAGCQLGNLYKWDLAQIQPPPSESLPSNRDPILGIAASPSEEACAVAAGRIVTVQNLKSGACQTDNGFAADFLAWLPDDNRLLGIAGDQLGVWHLDEAMAEYPSSLIRYETPIPPQAGARVYALAGWSLYMIRDGALTIFDLRKEKIETTTVPLRDLMADARNPDDGEVLITACTANSKGILIYGSGRSVRHEGSLSVFDVKKKRPVRRLKCEEKIVHLTSSPDGNFIVAVMSDGQCRVYDEALRQVGHFTCPKSDLGITNIWDSQGRCTITADNRLFMLDRERLIMRDLPSGRYLASFFGLSLISHVVAGRKSIFAGDNRGQTWWLERHAPLPTAPRPIRKRYALTIGVSQYSNESKLRLPCAANDARQLARTLSENGYAVTGLWDRPRSSRQPQPTRANILRALSSLRLHADDLLLVHMSCHGVRLDGKELLLVRDSRWTADSHEVRRHAIELSQILTLMKKSGARNLVLLLDACYLGTTATEKRTRKSAPKQTDAVAIITGSAADEEALESSDEKLGVFTSFVLRALGQSEEEPSGADAGECSKGYVTLDDLAHYVVDGVSEAVGNETQQRQRPTARIAGFEELILVDRR